MTPPTSLNTTLPLLHLAPTQPSTGELDLTAGVVP